MKTYDESETAESVQKGIEDELVKRFVLAYEESKKAGLPAIMAFMDFTGFRYDHFLGQPDEERMIRLCFSHAYVMYTKDMMYRVIDDVEKQVFKEWKDEPS